MTSGVVPLVLLVTFLAVVLPIAQGLKCYQCVTDTYHNPGSDPKTPAVHDNCWEGEDFTDNMIQTCTEDNSNNFLNVNTSSNEGGWRGGFACTANEVAALLKEGRPAGINNGTHELSFIRSCTLAPPPTPAQLKEHCEFDMWTLRPNRWHSTTFCYCYKDKCNGSIRDEETVEKVTEVVGAGSHDVVGLGLQALISIALASLCSNRL